MQIIIFDLIITVNIMQIVIRDNNLEAHEFCNQRFKSAIFSMFSSVLEDYVAPTNLLLFEL